MTFQRIAQNIGTGCHTGIANLNFDNGGWLR
jgi:hypothetical protein